jgi:hypothetical protein
LDRYFSCSKTALEVSELHISGVASMFMASKYEDIYPLLMRTVFKKIGHGKLPESQIKDRETKMLNSFGWIVG